MIQKVHLAAATAWIRSEADIRRYCADRAADIGVKIDGQAVMLSEMAPEDREAHIERFVELYREVGFVPYTLQDAHEAFAKAEALAKEVGNGARPFVRVERG